MNKLRKRSDLHGTARISRERDPRRAGIAVATGQSNWFNDPSLAGGLIGAIFWPPLILFPLARGINNYGLYQDIWQAVDTYCAQAGAIPGTVSAEHAVYCSNCGSINDEDATTCRMCGAPLNAPQQVPQYRPSQQAPQYQPPVQQASGQETVVCPHCGASVAAGNFCSNCAAPLRS
jgi:uncharacterized paraquat-inducible protein A